MGNQLPDITQSALFLEAAAEAREASRRYWAKGGAADRKYPLQEIPDWWWPIGPDGPCVPETTAT